MQVSNLPLQRMFQETVEAPWGITLWLNHLMVVQPFLNIQIESGTFIDSQILGMCVIIFLCYLFCFVFQNVLFSGRLGISMDFMLCLPNRFIRLFEANFEVPKFHQTVFIFRCHDAMGIDWDFFPGIWSSLYTWEVWTSMLWFDHPSMLQE